MNDKQYYVRGCTALLDAVGGAIEHMQKVRKYAREEERNKKEEKQMRKSEKIKRGLNLSSPIKRKRLKEPEQKKKK